MQKRTSFFILLFLSSLILLSLFPGCLPVTPVTVTGTVSGYVALPDDTTKNLTGYSPIPGATVTIVDADGVTHTVLTDENGYYYFNNISIKTNTIINITKDTEGGGKLIFKDIVPLAVSQEEDYDAGIADAESTAIALVVEGLVNLGQVQEEIDLDEITSSDGFDELKEDIQQAQEDNQDFTTDNLVNTQAEEIADNIVNPPEPTSDPTPSSPPAATLESIAITTPASKLSYSIGDALDITGLVVTGSYSDTTTKVETITTGNVTGFDSSAPADDQVLTITVGGKTTTYAVNIIATPITAIAAISGTPQVGVELTAGALTPVAATATYQWQICTTSGGTYTNITGATTNKYTPVAGDATKFIKVVATGTGSYSGSVTSAPTTAVAAATYTLTYDGNGDTDGTVPTDANNYEEGGSVTVLDNTGNLVKTGYTFAGWNTQADGSGTDRTVGSTFTIGASNVTLYAQWTPLYALRDTGPAGGLIFHVKEGGYSNGWMYLEAAPSDQSTGIAWSNITDTLIGTTGTAIGTGQTNTTAIVGQADCASGAAKLCYDYSVTVGSVTYSDWFLPSRDELNKMYINLKKGTDENSVTYTPVGGFEDYLFWSSSESDAYNAWYQDFGNGAQYSNVKFGTGRVRAVRAF